MATKAESSEDLKRKRESTSSEADNSLSSINDKNINDKNMTMPTDKQTTEKQKKKKNKKGEQAGNQASKPQQPEEQKDVALDMNYIRNELSCINKQLSNVLKKDDGDLKIIIETLMQNMKKELTKSIEKKIDVLEEKLFTKEQENDSLKKKIGELSEKLESSKDEEKKLRKEVENLQKANDERINELDQYTRRNNVIIDGLPDNQTETAEMTMELVAKSLNQNATNLNIKPEDIDIAHRLGKFQDGKRRAVIVKLQSRMKKIHIMKKKKELRATKIYVREHLTKLNQTVVTCVRVKMKDIVKSVWTKEGAIYYKDVNDQSHEVKFKNFTYWMNLPWPEKSSGTANF